MYRTLGSQEKRERSTTITLTVAPALRERLEQMASENERSLGAEVRMALKHHLEDENGGEA